MTIYSLVNEAQELFAGKSEIFAGVQFGQKDRRYFLILGCQVAVELDERAPPNLAEFYASTWGSERTEIGIVKRYQRWMESLKQESIDPYLITRADLTSFVATFFLPRRQIGPI